MEKLEFTTKLKALLKQINNNVKRRPLGQPNETKMNYSLRIEEFKHLVNEAKKEIWFMPLKGRLLRLYNQ